MQNATRQRLDGLLGEKPASTGHALRAFPYGFRRATTTISNYRCAARLGLDGPYAVATLHRPANVDTVEAAWRLVTALHELAARLPIVLPLHPRGRATLTAAGLLDVPGLQVVEPLGYVEFLSLVAGSAVVVTDSGGIQEETTILGIPCLTLRPNTERPITISHGTNRLVEPDALGPAVDAALLGELARPGDGPPLWDGHAGERIAALVADWLAGRP